MLAGIIKGSNSNKLDLPVEIKTIRDALRRYSRIDAIINRIDLINEALSISQQEVLNVSKAAILYNHHQFTCKSLNWIDWIKLVT